VSVVGMNMAKKAIKLENTHTHENPLFKIYIAFALLKQKV